VTRFSLLAALWAVSLALLLEPAIVLFLALDADVALSLAAAPASALLATLAREKRPYLVPLLTIALVTLIVFALAKPLRLSACEGDWCVAEHARSFSPWLFAALPGSAALGSAFAYGLRALVQRTPEHRI